MILDKKLNGILDQDSSNIVIFDELPSDTQYQDALVIIQNMSKVVDILFSKAKKLSWFIFYSNFLFPVFSILTISVFEQLQVLCRLFFVKQEKKKEKKTLSLLSFYETKMFTNLMVIYAT